MPRIRCSKLPNMMTCANSVVNPDGLTEVETENGAAETGTIVHALAEDLVRHDHCDLKHHAIRLKEIDGLDRAVELLPKIERIWQLAKPVFIKPILEEYLEAEIAPGIFITGHIDINEAFETHAFILDWKTGRQRVEHYHQVMGYAFLVWVKMGRPDDYEFYITVAYVEDGVNGLEKMPVITPADLAEWALAVCDKLKDHRYVTSEKCVHCPLANTCVAHREKQESAVRVITGTGGQLRTMEDRADVINRLKIVEDAVKTFRGSLKADVQANGPIDLGDGTHYVIEEKRQETLNAAQALTVLGDHGLTPSDVVAAAKLSLPNLRQVVYKRAVKGDKGESVTRLNDALIKAKALFQSTSSQMWRRKIPK
jgi:hypothetical protein